MKTVNMHEAKTHLSRLVDEALSGGDVVIARAGRPMVRLVPVARPDAPRVPGVLAGRVRELDPEWWGPDPELESLFYGWTDTDPLGPAEGTGTDGG